MKESAYNVWVTDNGRRWVYNGLSGAMVAVDADRWPGIRAFIAGDDSVDADSDVLHDLVMGRMLVSDECDELALLENRYRASRHNTTAFNLTVVTSLGCNFDCPYCFEAKRPSILNPRVQTLLLELVDAKLASATKFVVTWFGGEPLLGKEALLHLSDEFIRRADVNSAQYVATVITNGYLLTRDVALQLRERRVASAQVTLDGPAEIHDRMRPLASGRGTFTTILENLVAVVDILDVSIRVNLDTSNVGEYEGLLDSLVDAGMSGKVTVYPGQIVQANEDAGSPSASYEHACLSTHQFAEVERTFAVAAEARGFRMRTVPGPIGAPCTAVRANDLVIGSEGELYKCWDSVGNAGEVIGHIDHWRDPNDRVLKWVSYDPFSDPDCTSCRALPVCMGGCAHHALHDKVIDSRCSTFRYTYLEQVREQARRAAARNRSGLLRVLP